LRIARSHDLLLNRLILTRSPQNVGHCNLHLQGHLLQGCHQKDAAKAHEKRSIPSSSFFFFFCSLGFSFLAFGLFQADSVSLLHSAATTTGAPTPPLGLVAGNQVLGSAGDVANPEVPNDPPQAPPELDRQHTFIPMDVDFDEQAMWMGYGEGLIAGDPTGAGPLAQVENDVFGDVDVDPEPNFVPPDFDAEGSEGSEGASDADDVEDAEEVEDVEEAEEAEAGNDPEAPQEDEAPPFTESPWLSEKVYPGSHRTLKEVLLMVMTLTSQNKLTLEALGDLLRVLHQLLPPGNLLPQTTYKLFKLIGLDVDRFERHVCSKDCHVFDDLEKSEYVAHSQDTCPVCDTPRFVRRGDTWSPAKKFYALPLSPQIEALKRRPGFDSSVANMWNSLNQDSTFHDSFWGGSLAEPYLSRCHDLNDFQQLLCLCLGMDGVNAFKTTYSVWPIGVRIWNLHPEERNSKDFVLLTALVPGPKPPSNLGPYLKPLLEEIKKTETAPAEIYNHNLRKQEKLTLDLATSLQDQMSQIKSTEHIGPCGHINCWRCCHPSVPNEGESLFCFCLESLSHTLPSSPGLW